MATDLRSPSAGTSTQSTLSEWAGPYVTGMLGKAQALADQPYQVYQGPMTAGASQLQQNVFSGLGSLTVPQNLGQSFTGMGAPKVLSAATVSGDMGGMQLPMGGMGGRDRGPMLQGPSSLLPSEGGTLGTEPMATTGAYFGPFDASGRPVSLPMPPEIAAQYGGPSGIGALTSQPSMSTAQQYMNPYLQSVLQPQLEEMRRQAQINLQPSLAKLTQAGGYGGSREALMRTESDRNLLDAMTGAIGKGYASAFDTARQQFNTEQQQARDLVSMLSQAGQTQRGIEQEGITADYNEFLAQRDYPMKMTQYLQSMLQGLPISTLSTSMPQQSGIGQLASTVGGLGSTYDLLKKLGVV